MIPSNRKWKVTFHYGDCIATQWVTGPTKLLALWNAREQQYGHWIISDPKCTKETVSVVRSKFGAQHA